MSNDKNAQKQAQIKPEDNILDICDKKIEQTLELVKNNEDLVKRLYDKKDKEASIYPIVAYVLNKDNSLKNMKERQFDNETIYQVLLKFQFFIMMLAEYQTIVPTRELFCMFIGWNTALYQELAESESDVQEVINLVEDYILDFNMSAAQNGQLNANLTRFRTQISGKHGHSQVTKKEENMQNRSDARKDKEQLARELEEIKAKALENK